MMAYEPRYDKLILNSLTQKQIGNDTNFTLYLQKQYTARTIILDQFVSLNLFSNISTDPQLQFYNFGIQVYAGNQAFDFSGTSMSQAEVIAFINANNTLGLVFTLTQFGNINTITSTVPFYLFGNGWQLFGFDISQITDNHVPASLALNWVAQHYYNFGHSPVIYIRFNNITNSSNSYQGSASFTVPMMASMGQKIAYDSSEANTNRQRIEVGRNDSFDHLDITLLDQYFQPLQTDVSNQLNLPVMMQITLEY